MHVRNEYSIPAFDIGPRHVCTCTLNGLLFYEIVYGLVYGDLFDQLWTMTDRSDGVKGYDAWDR